MISATRREIAYLGLLSKKVSYRRFLDINHTFKSVESFFSASQQEVNAFCHKVKLKEVFSNISEVYAQSEDLYDFCEKEGIVFRSIEHPLYPERLKEIYEPPLGIFLKGGVEIFDKYALNHEKVNIAVVGTRKARQYSLDVTKSIAAALAKKRFNIISGFASGVDSAAHIGALSSVGMTTAVFGCGIKYVFPRENVKLLRDLYESGGVVVSEYLPKEKPQNYYFPQRNRIISALSDAVLLIEAGEKSGALITVKHALDQNKEVFVFDNEGDSRYYKGNDLLIKEGAKSISKAEDIIAHLYGATLLPEQKNEEDSEVKDEVIGIFGQGPLSLDEISKRMKKSPDEVLIILVPYLLEGKIIESAGNHFYKNPET